MLQTDSGFNFVRNLKQLFKLDYLNKGRILNNVCLSFVIFLCYSVLPSSAHKLRLHRIDDCTASLGGQIINLEPLARLDGNPRFEVEYQGWRYTYNPCLSYNLPSNPHDGRGDGCHYVTMCKWQETSDGYGEYFTLGIERTTKFAVRRPGEEVFEQNGASDNEESLSSSESSSEETNDTSSESSDSEDLPPDEDGVMKPNKTSIILQVLSPPNVSFVSNSTDENLNAKNNTDGDLKATNGSQIQKRSVNSPRRSLILENLKRFVGDKFNARNKRDVNHIDNDEIEDMDENDKDDVEEIDDSDEENVPVEDMDLIVKLRGIRRMKHQRSLIYLICDRKRSTVEDALFLLREFEKKDIIFELHHKCCCPGSCELGLTSELNNTGDGELLSAKDRRFKELEENGPRFLWLVLVVNAAIILGAILIGTTFCRKGGSGPYNMLPIALNSSRFTLNSVESLKYPIKRSRLHRGLSGKSPARAPEYLEYTSSLLKMHQTPLLDDVVISAKDLDIGQRLGGGLFGDTYLAAWSERTVAVKRITIGVHQNQMQEDHLDWISKEATFLSRQRHKNIVSMIGICFELRQPHIINEFVEGQSLKDLLIKEGETISMIRRVKLLQQAVDGLHFLHSVKARPILHRDLRCANLLVTGQDRSKVKIADFGVIRLTQKLRQECTGRKGCYCQKNSSGLPASIRWTAPEILYNPTAAEGSHPAVTTACDVYSFAMVLWEVASAQDPFFDIESEEEVREIVLNGGRPDADELFIVPHYRELMRICWEQEPENRPSFKQISNHLKNVHSNTVKLAVKVDKTARSVDSLTTSYLRSALNI